MKRVPFVTFEGGEGAGKTTLIARVAEELKGRGIPCLVTREPGGSGLGEEIRELLLHRKEPISPYAELALFLASRAQHIAETIEPALKAGKWVLCDRFNDSTIAYQGGARGLGMEAVGAMCGFVSQGLEPDLTLYLDIDPEVGLKRAKKRSNHDRIEAEEISFHRKIREAYLSLYRQHPERVHLIDATLPIETIGQKAGALLFSLQDG